MDLTLSVSGGWGGGVVTPSALCVLAANPGPMTLDGTNTWVLSAAGSGRAVVVDPGPDDEEHLVSVLAAVRGLDAEVTTVLLSHGHLDHSAGARRFAELSGAGVRALDPALCHAGEPLADGVVLEPDTLGLQVLAVPGHTADSVAFLLPGERALLTGDTVLGRGTAVVAHPDGRLGAYLESLARLREVAGVGGVELLLPGHGPVSTRPADVLQHYLDHRHARLDQVRAALAAGTEGAAEVTSVVYAELDPVLRPAAELSVLAQLAYLEQHPGG